MSGRPDANGEDSRVQPRIVTLTLNPALDVAMKVSKLEATHKMRASGAIYDPGGGINVARVISALHGEALAVFAKGGTTGRFVRELLSQEGVPCIGVPVRGTTRVSVTVHDRATGEEYRFVPEGPTLAEKEAERI